MRLRSVAPHSLVALCLAAILIVACGSDPQVDRPRETVSVETAGGSRFAFQAEVMRTPKELWTGLRWRAHLADDHAMLFDFGHVRTADFTMSDTLIPLDILFADSEGRIIRIYSNLQPGTPGPYSSGAPARGVLELNGGTAERRGIAVGDLIRHPIFAEDTGGRP